MIRVIRPQHPLRASVNLPASKSITNRLYIIRALSEEKFAITNESSAGDSHVLRRALEKIAPEIDTGDAGTAFRFLTAFLSVREGEYRLTGSRRMKQRPVGKLVEALRSLGASIEFEGESNYPPLLIKGKKIAGGKISIDASESSQFVSALMLIGPTLKNGLTIELTGNVRSFSYLSMTKSLMKYFGVDVKMEDKNIFIPPQPYRGSDIAVEADWSAASFWYEAVAIDPMSEVTLNGISMNSIQGDVEIMRIMKSFGVTSVQSDEHVKLRNSGSENNSSFSFDFSSYPDLVMPVAAVCAANNISGRLSGVGNLRIKESDRLKALENELGRVGVKVETDTDEIIINPSGSHNMPERFLSYDDHRMAMSLAFLALKCGEVVIDGHEAVNKSYPGFWEELNAAGFRCEII